MGAVNQPTNHEHESCGVKSKRHGISSSTKLRRKGLRPSARPGSYCVGVEVAF